MFASPLIIALAAAQISVPLGRPRVIEQPRAPIEVAGPAFARACEGKDGWDDPAPPVRIHANTYLVGTCGISAILITGDAGHIVIDAGTDKGADLIARSIRALGFQPRDVRILLSSHEHLDHVGGLSRLKQLTGARVIASPAAAPVLETGAPGRGDPQAGMHPPFAAVRVDEMVTDIRPVRLGNLQLTAVSTPGHTPGALSWHWGACDGGVCRRIVYADSLSIVSRDDYRYSDHPDYVAAFRGGLKKLAALECDILLTPHPSASDMVNRMAGKAPLTNEAGCRDYAAKQEKALDERLAKEAAAK